MSDDYQGYTIDGRYRLDELLGEGAMGAVYSGVQLAVDRRVAVKVLHAFLRGHDNFKARFELEARALARLSHPNAVTLYDYGYSEELDAFYMVLQYVEGQPLAEMMEYVIPQHAALQIAYQVTLALEHAHEQGILHRDLKPENVMVSMEHGLPRVTVLDFGLARLLVEEASTPPEHGRRRPQRLTKAGEIYGTPAYMSPEQCKGNNNVGPQSDLYTLGVLLFELLDSRLPFYHRSPAQMMLMQISNPVPRMKTAVDPDLEGLIQWLMAKDPDKRPRSATDVLNVLRPHLGLQVCEESTFSLDSGDFRVFARADESGEHHVSVPTMVFSDADDTQPRRALEPGPSGPTRVATPSPPMVDPRHALPRPMRVAAVVSAVLAVVFLVSVAFGAGMYYSNVIDEVSAQAEPASRSGDRPGDRQVVLDESDAR